MPAQNSYDMIAIDMDGTLLSSRLTVTPMTVAAIQEAMAAGREVVFCTGRSVSELRPYLAPFAGMHYAVCEAGACLYDLRAERTLVQESFTREQTSEIVEIIRDCDVMASIYREGWTYTNLPDSSRMGRYNMADYAATFEQSTHWWPNLLREMPQEGVAYNKFVLFFHDQEERERVWQELIRLPVCTITCTRGNIEVSPQGIDKGKGLRRLCEQVGIPLSRVIAVGDSENDLPMLNVAGLAVAMGNAIPEAKRAAAVVVSDNDNDGVAEAIKDYLL